MYKKILMLLAVLMVLSSVSCTGANIAVMAGFTPNTDPMKRVNSAFAGGIFAKGGIAYYSDRYTGQMISGVLPEKEGKACVQSILGLVSFGDSSIETAASQARITKIAMLDHQSQAILGGYIWQEYCLIVYGE